MVFGNFQGQKCSLKKMPLFISTQAPVPWRVMVLTWGCLWAVMSQQIMMTGTSRSDQLTRITSRWPCCPPVMLLLDATSLTWRLPPLTLEDPSLTDRSLMSHSSSSSMPGVKVCGQIQLVKLQIHSIYFNRLYVVIRYTYTCIQCSHHIVRILQMIYLNLMFIYQYKNLLNTWKTFICL